MALASYADLTTQLTNWLARADLTAQYDAWIALVEAEVNRRLRDANMETKATLTTVGGTATLALPSNFGGLRRLYITSSNPPRPLDYMTPETLERSWDTTTQQGTPVNYTIIGTNLEFGPVPDTAYTLEATYYQGIASSLSSTSTNWLMASHPDVYLYGCLMHAEPYMGNDARIQTWGALYEKAITQLKDSDLKNRWGSQPLVMRSDLTKA